MHHQVDAIVKSMVENKDYKILVKDKTAHILDDGINKIEKSLGLKNLYDVKNSHVSHAVNQSLKANYVMEKDVDYVVKDGKIVIVDQFTGRTLEGRTFSDGLHQAIEAKENVEIQKETKTMATITYQNFFRLYDKLSGMTGTAKTEEEEFQKTYGMDVVVIPTNVPIARDDREDLIFANKHAKYDYLLALIKERHAIGQPILIGSVAIETSMEISRVLTKHNLKHQVLNAKHHEQEADIIANAGQLGVVTISTNMAGRGTDIKLDPKVKELEPFISELSGDHVVPGGLFVIGTERHESRRIDNQLRGRSGRQGDAGESIFLVSFEDDLLRRFASERSRAMLNKLGLDNDPISAGAITKQVEKAQKQVESVNYEIRKTLLKYDDVLREQREVMYDQRDYVIDSKDLVEDARKIIIDFVSSRVDYFLELNDLEGLKLFVQEIITNEEIPLTSENIEEEILELALNNYDEKVNVHGEEIITQFNKSIILKVLDEHWIEHIDEMQVLRESIGLRGYGQIDPLVEYQKDGRDMFDNMIDSSEQDIVKYILKGHIQTPEEREAMLAKLKQDHDRIMRIRNTTTIVNKKEEK